MPQNNEMYLNGRLQPVSCRLYKSKGERTSNDGLEGETWVKSKWTQLHRIIAMTHTSIKLT
jgi:hypothetical protein